MAFPSFSKGLQMSLSDVQDEVNRLFERVWHSGIATGPFDGQKWSPTIDVFDEPSQFVLTAEVPGLQVADIEVTYEDGEVVISGQKLCDREAGDQADMGYVQRERRFGSFCRRVRLPEPIQPESIRASCRHGVLEITLPKKEPLQRHTVRIDVSDG